MKKIFLFAIFLIFFASPSVSFGAVSYSRTPSGNQITSPISISISFDNFEEDTGCVSDTWSVEVSNNNNSYYPSNTILNSIKTGVFSINLPPIDCTYVAFSCDLEGGGNYIEGDGNSIIFNVPAPTPIPGGFSSKRPEVAITAPKSGLAFSSIMKIEYQATDKNDLGNATEREQLGLGLTPVSIFYSDKIYEWNHSIIDALDKTLIAKDLSPKDSYLWNIPKELAEGSLYRIIIDAVDNGGDVGENVSDFFTIDRTAPVFSITADRTAITKTGEVKITAQSSKELVAPPTLTVTQRGYKAVEVLMSGAGKLFEGIYKVVTGFDGPAAIGISGQDQSGNVSATIVSGRAFSVGIEPPPKPIIDFPLQEKVTTKENNISVKGHAREDTEVILLLNGTTELKTKPEKDGSFIFDNVTLDPQYLRGENIFNIISRDDDGNESQAAIITVKFNFAPEVAFLFPQNNSTLSATSTIRIDASDKNNDALTFTYEIKPANSDNWSLIASSTPNKRYVLDTRNFADGEYVLRVTANDGFADTQVISPQFAIKNFLPVITFTGGELMITNNKDVVVSGTVSAPESPEGRRQISGLEYSMGGGKLWKAIIADVGAASFLTSAFSLSLSDLKEDEYTILFRAKDSRGFYGRAAKTVIVDFGPPAKPVVSSPKSLALITDKDDEDSGLAGIQFTVSGTAEPKSEVSVVLGDAIFKATTNSEGAFAVHGVTLKQRNKNDFVVFATDKARNKSSEVNASVVYNNPPIVKFINPRQNRGLHGVADVQWGIEDIDSDSVAGVILSYRRGNGSFSVLTKSASQNSFKWDVSDFQEGSGYQLKIEATDGITPTTSIIDIYIDNTPPEIEISPLNQTSFKKAFSLSARGTASDNLSGIEFIEYSVDGKNWFKAVMASGYLGRNASFRISHPFALGDGEYNFGVRAVDAAGNVSRPKFQKITVDTTPPRIGSYTVSLGQMNFLPKNGSFEILSGSKVKLTISLEEDTAEAFLTIGDNKINLSKNKATGLWEAELSFSLLGKLPLAITAADLLGNKITGKEIGSFNAIPAGKTSVGGAKIYVSIWSEDNKSLIDWRADNYGGNNPTFSSENGEYKLALPAGKFQLLIQKTGFEKIKTNEFVLDEPSFINFDFTLIELKGVWGFIENIMEKIGL
ncbi:MAG: Ig-like domain-containing protein [Candidatus Paceibacterota bacterium]